MQNYKELKLESVIWLVISRYNKWHSHDIITMLQDRGNNVVTMLYQTCCSKLVTTCDKHEYNMLTASISAMGLYIWGNIDVSLLSDFWWLYTKNWIEIHISRTALRQFKSSCPEFPVNSYRHTKVILSWSSYTIMLCVQTVTPLIWYAVYPGRFSPITVKLHS